MEKFQKNVVFLVLYILLLFLQIWVLITTLALVSVGTWGTLLIRQHFDPVLLLPANTYLRSYLALHKNHFPQVCFSAAGIILKGLFLPIDKGKPR